MIRKPAKMDQHQGGTPCTFLIPSLPTALDEGPWPSNGVLVYLSPLFSVKSLFSPMTVEPYGGQDSFRFRRPSFQSKRVQWLDRDQ
jgi:hypothetical protein